MPHDSECQTVTGEGAGGGKNVTDADGPMPGIAACSLAVRRQEKVLVELPVSARTSVHVVVLGLQSPAELRWIGSDGGRDCRVSRVRLCAGVYTLKY